MKNNNYKFLFLFISLHTTKKNPGKVPKRIHKAEREKMKREHLNDLFLELAGALGNFSTTLINLYLFNIFFIV